MLFSFVTSYHFYENKIKIHSGLGSRLRGNNDCFFNGNNNYVTPLASIQLANELNDYSLCVLCGEFFFETLGVTLFLKTQPHLSPNHQSIGNGASATRLDDPLDVGLNIGCWG